MMNSKNYNKKIVKGFSLLEAMAAIALTGVIIVSVLNLLSVMREKTFSAHKGVEPLWSVKNYWYETERSLGGASEQSQKKFTKPGKNENQTLTIEIKKSDEKNKSFQKLANLEIILLTAISNLGQRAVEDQLFFCVAIPDGALEEKKAKK